MAGGAGRLAVAAHPAVIGALTVLVANDRVLKGWSGTVDGATGTVARTVTGKASDLAGVFLLAVLAGALTGRRRSAVLAVGAAFVALKLSPAVADLAAPVLGGRTRTDPWDLLALGTLVPADRLLRGDAARPSRDTRRLRASIRATLGLAVVVLSVPAMTATSTIPCEQRTAVVDLADIDGDLYAHLDEAGRAERPSARPGPASEWWRSADGGATWTRADPPRSADAVRVAPPILEGCTQARCYRSVGAVVQERTDGGPWVTSFAFDEAERRALRELSSCPLPDPADVAVARDVVVVAHGSEGVLRRRDGGGWERRPIGIAEPATTRALASPGQVASGAAVLLVVGAGLAVVAWRRRQIGLTAGAIAAGGFGAGLLFAALLVPNGSGTPYFLLLQESAVVPVVAALLIAITVVVFVAERSSAARRRPSGLA